MNNKRLSKFLSLILRHRPEKLGIVLDEKGWANTQEIISKLQQQNPSINLEKIQNVVENCPKQRFKLSEDCSKIRANQGHSVKVELGFEASTPPKILFHGTAARNKAAILEKGITKRKRQYVHLSFERETALKVGQRHGKPIILEINTEQMAADKLLFYQAENGVWLTDYIDPKYISI